MARPQRNNVDYFPFYCEEGKKMYYLENKYGNDGFATLVKILRDLSKTDYHYLDLSDETTMMFLSARCKISIEVLEAIINDLVKLKKFDKELWSENKIIWCQDLVDSIQDAYNKRSNECISYKGLLNLLVSLGVRKPHKDKSEGDVKPQSKVDYTKEKKRKEEFDRFWNEYDKKTGNREKIEKKFKRLSEEEVKLIFDYIPEYKKSQPEKKYRKNPETFLNNKGWQDELIKNQETVIKKQNINSVWDEKN